MRRASISLLLMACLAASPAGARDREPGREFGLAGASIAANLLYTPPKLLTALFGIPAGALTAVCTGWNLRAMYAVWVPTVTGTYFLTPSHLQGERPIEFFGSHYPSTLGCKPYPNTAYFGDPRCAKCEHAAKCEHRAECEHRSKCARRHHRASDAEADSED